MVQKKKNGGVGLKKLPLMFPREQAAYQLPFQNIFWRILGCKNV
jgi:hypothetical protein